MFNKDSQEDLSELKWAAKTIKIDTEGCFNALLLICDKLDEVNARLKAVSERVPKKQEPR